MASKKFLAPKTKTMIQVLDNCLPDEEFKALQDYCKNTDFTIMKAGDKEFSALPVPNNFAPHTMLNGFDITFSFIRKAYKGFDDDYRIHADNIILGRRTDLASVIYINDPAGVTENGTCFWSHKDHGDRLPYDVTEEEFDRLLNEDSNDLSKWTKRDVICSKPNRMVIYDSTYFHSKWPNEILDGERIVLATFYAVSEPYKTK